jgi:acyl-coenzyme A synthetase/AMP-(fatty) acid ligase
VRERLAAYKAPRHWVLVEEFPRTPLGKIRKFILRDGFVSSRGT